MQQITCSNPVSLTPQRRGDHDELIQALHLAALDEVFDALGFDCHESLRAMLIEREEEREVAAQLGSQYGRGSRRR